MESSSSSSPPSSSWTMDVVSPTTSPTMAASARSSRVRTGISVVPTEGVRGAAMQLFHEDNDDHRSQSGLKRGLTSSPPPFNASINSTSGAAATAARSTDSPDRRKMSRVAVWTGTPWGSNRHAVRTENSAGSLPTPLALLVPSLPQAPTRPPPQQPLGAPHPQQHTTTPGFGCDSTIPQAPDFRSGGLGAAAPTASSSRGVQMKWAAAALAGAKAAAAATVGGASGGGASEAFGGAAAARPAESYGGKATAPSWGTAPVGASGAFGGGGAARPAEPCGEGAASPSWSTGGGGGLTGGSGGESALCRRADEHVGGSGCAMDVVADNNGAGDGGGGIGDGVVVVSPPKGCV